MTETIIMRDGTEVADPRLGRLIQFDEQSREYPVRTLLAETGHDPHGSHPRARSYRWRVREHLDQGREGACVLFAHGHRSIGRPHERLGELTYDTQIGRYHRAQDIDEWESTRKGGEGGTSVLAGAKIMVEDDLYDQYRWVFRDLRDAVLTLGYLGSLVMGTWWTEAMGEPGADGFLHPTGRDVGGHAWLTYGIVSRNANGYAAWWVDEMDLDRSFVICRNSWGRGWGRDGDFYMTLREWNDLRLRQGEAMYAVEKAA